MATLYDTAQAAERLHLRPSTLVTWRCLGRGPAYKKIGGRVMYEDSDIATFLERCTVSPERGTTCIAA